MHTQTRRGHLLGGILIAGLTLLTLGGCSNVTQTPTAIDASVTSTMADPTAAAPEQYATAAVKPANPADAVATMAAPVIEASAGADIVADGVAPALSIDMGNTGAAMGNLPLQMKPGRVFSDSFAVLPAGDSALSLGADTCLDMFDPAELGRGTRRGLRITGFKLLFSVHRGTPPSWTLPTTFKLDLERVGKRRYVLKGSALTLYWRGRVFSPPADGSVKMTVTLYDDDVKVAGPLTKTVPVQNDKAVFTGNNDVEFNRVEILADMRDAK